MSFERVIFPENFREEKKIQEIGFIYSSNTQIIRGKTFGVEKKIGTMKNHKGRKMIILVEKQNHLF